MPVKVKIPTALRQYAGGQDTIDLDGDDVGQVLAKLGEGFPELAGHLFDDQGELRNFVNVYLNDQSIRDLEGSASRLSSGDELTIVPAIAGG
ncbi:MAG: molybdopterin synthase sulfur carrier subunit [Phycisphaeraceae bacterium]|nr:molybdopterin synthase sulfur carrier subunit [Phycisphaeraceae bacterium]